MKHIIKKLALLFVPVYLWFAFFVAFEPNNYFGIKKTASSSQPVARVRAYEQSPGTNLIIGDSRLAHFDMDLVDSLTGQSWQNLAFGGASLKECVDLANYVLDSGNQVDRILFELSFYTLNSSYNTDRFSALEATLRNPLAYCLNLEYNVNALTVFMDTVKGTPDTIESGDWTAADYLDDAGNTIPLHKKLYEYPALITTRCQNWTLNETELAEFLAMAQRCAGRGVEITASEPFSASALHYAQEALDEGLTKQQGHSQEIEPDDAVWLCIDKAQYGLGCIDSWGQLPLRKYRMPYGNYEFEFKIRPL